jgi:WD40-like Beta Propeller Repeat
MKIKQIKIVFVGVVTALTFGSIIYAQHFGDWAAPVSVESIPGTSSELNTTFNEICAIQSPDGLSLFITSNRPGGMGGGDIWVSRRAKSDDPFGAPENLGAPVNTAANDFCPTPVRGGGLYFVSSRVVPGVSCGGADIYFTRFHRGEYEAPQNLGCDINSSAQDAYVSYFEDDKDNSYLYFSSNRPGGFEPGGSDVDIYFSLNGGAPQLAPGLNTASNDFQPNVRKDGREVVFGSNRTGTLGGDDIWTATRESISDDWLLPVHLDAPINGPAGETRPTLSWDGLTMYFDSNRPGGEGLSDNYVTTREKLRGNE